MAPLLLLAASAAWSQELLTFAGYHTQLYGYTDDRYVDDDNGDYLKTVAWYTGTEFVQKGFDSESALSKRIVLGAGVLLYVQNAFDPVDLYAVPSQGIGAETVPSDREDRAARFQVVASAFGGYQSDWWGAEGGLSVFIVGVEESVRERYDTNGNIVEGEGRGWVFGEGSLILPNLRLRAGPEAYPHFELSLYRGHYDPGYGAFQARVVVPFNQQFTLQVGGSLFQTSSVFVEPGLTFGDFTASLRAGTILNYNDDDFTRVGVFEGAFLAGSLAVRW